jgi:hypothetical protein
MAFGPAARRQGRARNPALNPRGARIAAPGGGVLGAGSSAAGFSRAQPGPDPAPRATSESAQTRSKLAAHS